MSEVPRLQTGPLGRVWMRAAHRPAITERRVERESLPDRVPLGVRVVDACVVGGLGPAGDREPVRRSGTTAVSLIHPPAGMGKRCGDPGL
jgi:hypothetical protein